MRLLIVAGTLVLAVSASLTPANAATPYSMDGCYGRNCRCSYQRYGKPRTLCFAILRRCKPGAFCDRNVIPPDIHACLATCMAAQEAARR
jgi:hypothetical protein